MKGLSRREALVFLAKPVHKKPNPKPKPISFAEFSLDNALAVERKRKEKAVKE